MIILHDEATLLHETVELLGSKLRPALESPERIKAIVQTLRNSPSSSSHDLRIISTTAEDEEFALTLAQESHSSDYLTHIQHVFDQWHTEGLVELHESVLPECFRIHSSTSMHETPQPPKDIYARAGYYAFDMSTGMTRHSWTSIMASANLAIKATEILTNTDASNNDPTNNDKSGPLLPRSICALTRPPGHHCTGTQAGGYCYINNIMLPISYLRHQPTSHLNLQDTSTSQKDRDLKFAILDLDFHHGNGTQELTFTDPSILYVSIHGADEFPYYIGFADEIGVISNPLNEQSDQDNNPNNTDESQVYTNLNLPLHPGSSFAEYCEHLEVAIERIQTFKPDYLLVSLGFDTFHLDPLGRFQIETEDYYTMANKVRGAISQPKSVILLEGGYVIDRLGVNLLSFLRGWHDAELGKS